MQTEQITTRYFEDGKIQMIDKSVWDFWTKGNPEFKAVNGLTTVEVPEDLLDKPIKFNTQTMTWEDASEDEINQVKTRVKKLSDELDKTREELKKAQADNSSKQEQIEELETNANSTSDTIADLTFQVMQLQGGQQNA